MSSTSLSVSVRLWRRSRPAIGVRSDTLFPGSSSSISRLQCSSPVRSWIPLPRAVMVEIVATSSAVIGSSVFRFSKTYLLTASSRFLSGKIWALAVTAHERARRIAAALLYVIARVVPSMPGTQPWYHRHLPFGRSGFGALSPCGGASDANARDMYPLAFRRDARDSLPVLGSAQRCLAALRRTSVSAWQGGLPLPKFFRQPSGNVRHGRGQIAPLSRIDRQVIEFDLAS